MADDAAHDTALDRLGSLTDPVRRALYDYVAASDAPVGREQAAEAVDISRSLAAYHLDRLADDGLLQVSYRRLTGRAGPGAGRPAKLYERAPGEVSVHLPARDYPLVADVLAAAVEATGPPAIVAVEASARATGIEAGTEAGKATAGKGRIRNVLDERGYESFEDADGSVRLRNCPFDRLADRHRTLVCSANRALLDGLLEGLGADRFEAVLDPRPGECCVAIRRRG